MSYRCEVCEKVVPPGTPCIRHVQHRKWVDAAGRERNDVLREVKVCGGCKRRLEKAELPQQAATSTGLLRLYKAPANVGKMTKVRLPGRKE